MIHMIEIESKKSNKLLGLIYLNPPALLGFGNSCGSIGLLFSSTRTANMNINTSWFCVCVLSKQGSLKMSGASYFYTRLVFM